MKTIHDFPRVPLGIFPTPLHKLENLSRRYGKYLYVKRDDLTGEGLGGNKVRKLEFLLADAKAKGADVVFTTGGAQSNHAMLTAACCNKLGMKAVLILKQRGVTERKGNLILDHLLGCDAQFMDTDRYDDIYAEMRRQGEELKKQGHTPYYIPVGGSTALGALGYVAGMEETYRQAAEMGIHFDHTVCVCGSGGTTAGVALGTKLYSPGTKTLGIAVDDDPFDEIVPQLMREALTLLESDLTVEPEDVTIRFHVGKGYGIAGPEDTAAVKEVAQAEGIFFDPVYTGKAFCHFLQLLEEGYFDGEENILFLHSGGAGGLFAVELPE